MFVSPITATNNVFVSPSPSFLFFLLPPPASPPSPSLLLPILLLLLSQSPPPAPCAASLSWVSLTHTGPPSTLPFDPTERERETRLENKRTNSALVVHKKFGSMRGNDCVVSIDVSFPFQQLDLYTPRLGTLRSEEHTSELQSR